jgi:hypothetical protein
MILHGKRSVRRRRQSAGGRKQKAGAARQAGAGQPCGLGGFDADAPGGFFDIQSYIRGELK